MSRQTMPYVSIAVVLLALLGTARVLAQNPPAPPPSPRPFTPTYTGPADSGMVQSGKVETTTVTTVTTVDSDLEAQKRLRMQSTGESSPLVTRPTAAGTSTRTERVTIQTPTYAGEPATESRKTRHINHEHPEFMTSPTMRATQTGWYVGLMAGVNIAQDTEMVEPTGGGFDVSGDSDPAPMGSMRIGYTWKFTDEPIEQWRQESGTEGIFLTGSMEAELLYINSKIELSGAGASDEVDGHTIAPMLNFLMRGNWNKFSLYGGAGVGGAMAFYNGNQFAKVTEGYDDDSSFDLALQGILGLDYYIDQDWAVFGEYKYFIHYEPELFGTSPQNEQEMHLLGFGIKRRL